MQNRRAVANEQEQRAGERRRTEATIAQAIEILYGARPESPIIKNINRSRFTGWRTTRRRCQIAWERWAA